MDNAVRFDGISMLKSSEKSSSMDQESVDLNAYLAKEYRILKKIAKILNIPFQEPRRTASVHAFFFDSSQEYFFDRKLKTNDFVRIEGCEGWTPLWTEITTQEQADKVFQLVRQPNKFSSYIPFPTLAIDHPKYKFDDYWRGSIWLNQAYFGISGLRKYGYVREADHFTDQVFTRLQGLTESAPIYENYDPKTGLGLRAPHYSWSSASLLFLYWEYGKQPNEVKEQ